MVVLITYKKKKIESKLNHKVFHIISLWELSVAMETSSDLNWPEITCILSPTPMMPQIKFDCNSEIFTFES